MSYRPPNTYSWQDAPPEAIEAWNAICQDYSGAPGTKYPVTRAGWTFVLNEQQDRFFPLKQESSEDEIPQQ